MTPEPSTGVQPTFESTKGRMRRSIITCLVLAGAVVTPILSASAQYRGYSGFDRALTDSLLAEPPRIAPGVAALALQHAAELALVDSQQVLLAQIRRAQDSANRPWIERLEALRPDHHPVNPTDLSPEQQEEIATRRAAIAEVMDGMRDDNTRLRERALAVLTPEQQQRAVELENDARQWARDHGGPNVLADIGGSSQVSGGSAGGGMTPKPE